MLDAVGNNPIRNAHCHRQGDSFEGLLINGVFSNAVGHVVEALMVAQAYRFGNPDIRIRLLLNAAAPLILAEAVPHLSIEVIGVDLECFDSQTSAGLFTELFGKCRYQLTLRGSRAVGWGGARLKRFLLAYEHWVQREAISSPASCRMFPKQAPRQLRLQLSDTCKAYARDFIDHSKWPRIVILPSAASHQKAPTKTFWEQYIRRIFADYPRAEIVLVGLHGSNHGSTLGWSKSDVLGLVGKLGACKSAFNVGILNQLAIIETAQLFVSPHSGFGFAAQCVAAPWLIISGGPNHEYLTNGVPFISIHPVCPWYPCSRETMYAKCRDAIDNGKTRLLCMQEESVSLKENDFVEASHALIESRFSYRTCIKAHRKKLKDSASPSRIVLENVRLSPMRRAVEVFKRRFRLKRLS